MAEVIYSTDALKTMMPARSVKAVAPHSSNDLPDGTCDSLYIGGAGDVALIAADDSSAVTFVGLTAGQVLPVRTKAVRVSGTTATSIVALY